MNAALPRFLKSAYRREPLPSFSITVGIVDAVIGGLDERWWLFTFGLGTAGLAIALRWWLIRQRRPYRVSSVPQHYLPPQSSRPVLPNLSAANKNSPE